MIGLDSWLLLTLLAVGAAASVPVLAKGRFDASTFLAGLGLAGVAGFFMRSMSNDQLPEHVGAAKDATFLKSRRDRGHPDDREKHESFSAEEAMQRALKQARSSYTPERMDGTLPFPGPGQRKNSASKQLA